MCETELQEIAMHLVGIDIGGTKVEVVLFEKTKGGPGKDSYEVVSGQGEEFCLKVLKKLRVKSERHLGYEQVIGKMANLVQRVCKEAKVEIAAIDGIGLGLPGAVDPQKKTMVMGNTAAFVEKDVRADLAAELSYSGPMQCENDANCFALAEVCCGAGQVYRKDKGVEIKDQVAVGVILGTGVGGGFVVNGKAVTGANGGAGEIGHTILHSGGAPCYCGRDGCAEQYLSGPAIEASFATRLYSQIAERPSAQQIFEQLLVQNDPIAIAIIKKHRRDLAKFIGNISVVLDPHYFVLGGGVSRQSYIYEGLRDLVPAHLFVPGQGPEIYQHRIGDSAGVLGAALLCL